MFTPINISFCACWFVGSIDFWDHWRHFAVVPSIRRLHFCHFNWFVLPPVNPKKAKMLKSPNVITDNNKSETKFSLSYLPLVLLKICNRINVNIINLHCQRFCMHFSLWLHVGNWNFRLRSNYAVENCLVFQFVVPSYVDSHLFGKYLIIYLRLLLT